MSYSFHQVKKLEGPRIAMKPVQASELEEAGKALVSESSWFSRTRMIKSATGFVEYFSPRISQQERGEILTLLARDKATNEIVGLSTFQYPDAKFTRVEIGFSWVADKWQRTHVNTEMKLLMLTHAFEEMKALRAEFLVHPINEKSNAAMVRIGATLEGTLRKWRYLSEIDDGTRHIYSIIDDEWPKIKAKLKSYL